MQDLPNNIVVGTTVIPNPATVPATESYKYINECMTTLFHLLADIQTFRDQVLRDRTDVDKLDSSFESLNESFDSLSKHVSSLQNDLHELREILTKFDANNPGILPRLQQIDHTLEQLKKSVDSLTAMSRTMTDHSDKMKTFETDCKICRTYMTDKLAVLEKLPADIFKLRKAFEEESALRKKITDWMEKTEIEKEEQRREEREAKKERQGSVYAILSSIVVSLVLSVGSILWTNYTSGQKALHDQELLKKITELSQSINSKKGP